jgi:hypothetical protein
MFYMSSKSYIWYLIMCFLLLNDFLLSFLLNPSKNRFNIHPINLKNYENDMIELFDKNRDAVVYVG